MISFFPDLNVWLALSSASHSHSSEAWKWLNSLPRDVTLIFCRYTQIGLLRLLTTQSVMGTQTLTLRGAWEVYERWLNDSRIEFYPEPKNIGAAFRETTKPFLKQSASKAVGDCYLLAYAAESYATLVTFDKALKALAYKNGYPAVLPGNP